MSTTQMLQREFCRVIELCSSENTHKHLCTEAHHECTIYSMGLVALECPGSCSQTFIFHIWFSGLFLVAFQNGSLTRKHVLQFLPSIWYRYVKNCLFLYKTCFHQDSSCQCKHSAALWWTNFHFYSLINGGSFYFLLVHKANYVSYGSCQRCCLWMSLEQSMSLKRLLLE
jgi:hypothetical protein